MKADEIRASFLEFFEARNHKILPSASLVPSDPTTLLTTAGMQPFVPWFKREVEPEYPRVATCQKCLRQDDLDNVGVTARHLSFFEMLGNFSFGDYFKREAIEWAWEFVTQVFKLDPERLWISVHTTDDEAWELWHKHIGVPEARLFRSEDNWWGLGMPNTPCGPCTEIYVDLGPEYGEGEPGGDNDRYFELWNLVFQRYNDDGAGNLTELPKPGIDTGMGLERAAMLLQHAHSPFETDLFAPIVKQLQSLVGKKDLLDDPALATPARIALEHARAASFLISDGVMPSNEGRGYLLRRLIRRAYRQGRLLQLEGPFLYKLVPGVVEAMQGGYPELKQRSETIIEVLAREEQRFQETLSEGLGMLYKALEELKAKGEDQVPGAVLFRLYDTHGLPFELAREVAQEAGFKVDEEAFEAELEAQRSRSKFAGHEALDEQAFYAALARELGSTNFVGYTENTADAKVVRLLKQQESLEAASEGEEVEVILDTTPFYAESGGQVGDTGWLKGPNCLCRVLDTQKYAGELFVHKVKVERGKLQVGQVVQAEIDVERRRAIERNHSATHLLHSALRKVLGEHARQAGAYKDEKRLRFDFTHYQPLTAEELAELERLANEVVLADYEVTKTIQPREEAEKRGAMALFGEKYGAKVRVVEVPGFSIELCGGCHVRRTGEIGLIKIISESGIGSNLRRIEAVTGLNSLAHFQAAENRLHEASAVLGVPVDEVGEGAKRLLEQVKQREKEIKRLKQEALGAASGDTLEKLEERDGVKFLGWEAKGADAETLRALSDKLINRLQSGVLALAGEPTPGKVVLLVRITKDLTGKVKAGELAKRMAKLCGGGGGGRPDFAQAGGKDASKLPEAFEEAREYLKAAFSD